jgi:hypothetical protein
VGRPMNQQSTEKITFRMRMRLGGSPAGPPAGWLCRLVREELKRICKSAKIKHTGHSESDK